MFDLSKTEPPFPLDGINEALACVRERPGGFVNVVVNPINEMLAMTASPPEPLLIRCCS